MKIRVIIKVLITRGLIMEWEQLQETDIFLHNQIAQLTKWKKQLEALAKQYYHAKQDRERIERLLMETRTKLKALESDSFINRIKLLFQKGEAIEEQLQIAAERELKFYEAIETEKDFNQQIEELKTKIKSLNEKEINAQIEVNKLKMKTWLNINRRAASEKLEKLVEREELAGDLIREIEEAIDAGNEAKTALINAFKEMDDAKKYSSWDTFFGGGLYATFEKHERIRVGNTYLHSAQSKLQQFHNELLDIEDVSYNMITVNTDGIVKFSDYFFDDIFSAYAVHKKITNALNYTNQAIADVSNMLELLSGKLEIARGEKKKIKEEIQKIFNSSEQSLKL